MLSTEKDFLAMRDFVTEMIVKLQDVDFPARLEIAFNAVLASPYKDDIDVVELVNNANVDTYRRVAKVLAKSPLEKRASLCKDTYVAMYNNYLEPHCHRTTQLAHRIAQRHTDAQAFFRRASKPCIR